MTCGELVRLRRISRGLTMQQLADAIGVSKNAIFKMEHGKMEISARRVVHLAEALRCDPAELIPDEDGERVSTVVDLVQEVEGMRGEDITQLIQYARFLKAQRDK